MDSGSWPRRSISPQSPQNWLSGGLCVPQAGQIRPTGLPHFLQKFAFENAALRQWGQVMKTPRLSGLIGCFQTGCDASGYNRND
jgi:hypothetical protein